MGSQRVRRSCYGSYFVDSPANRGRAYRYEFVDERRHVRLQAWIESTGERCAVDALPAFVDEKTEVAWSSTQRHSTLCGSLLLRDQQQRCSQCSSSSADLSSHTETLRAAPHFVSAFEQGIGRAGDAMSLFGPITAQMTGRRCPLCPLTDHKVCQQPGGLGSDAFTLRLRRSDHFTSSNSTASQIGGGEIDSAVVNA